MKQLSPLCYKHCRYVIFKASNGHMTSIYAQQMYACNLQEGSTLQSQTSLAALLQSQESEALSSAKGCSPKASP